MDRRSAYQVTIAMQPAPGAEPDFVAWYRAEHLPVLLRGPGCRRVRLFEQVEDAGPRWLALPELESESAAGTDAYRAALAELASRCDAPPETRLFKLLRSYTDARPPSAATALSSGP
jgi:hypothetical protein